MDQTVIAQMIGAPFLEKGRGLSGFDCWGAARFGLLHACGIEVPSYVESYATTREGEEIAALIGRASTGWEDVPLSAAQPGDVLIIRIKGFPWHCGLVIDPPYFVHADRSSGTVRDRWDSLRWSKRIVSVHRYRSVRW